MRGWLAAGRAGVGRITRRSVAGALVLAVVCVLVLLTGGAVAGGTAPLNTVLPVVSGKALAAA
jgi:hypothetical protein